MNRLDSIDVGSWSLTFIIIPSGPCRLDCRRSDKPPRSKQNIPILFRVRQVDVRTRFYPCSPVGSNGSERIHLY